MQKQNCTVGGSIEANLKYSDEFQEKDMPGSPEDIRQWEEARCPVCLEHPHNAVLLRCSSYANGCRPFMCNTSSHHSNCLDQFRKSPEPSPSSYLMPGISCGQTDCELEHKLPSPSSYNMPEIFCGQTDGESEHTLTCPLCRGQVYGWFAIEPARAFMNSKKRSCSTETCNFIGSYMELRKHARSEHPSVRPSAVDPERQRNWTRLENETHLSDLLSMLPSMNLGVNSNAELEEEVVILDGIDTEPAYNNIGFVAVNSVVAMLDEILCFDSIIQYTDWRRQRNYSRGNRVERVPQNYARNNLRGRNNNYISRQNNSFRERIPRNNRDGRYNNVNNNLNPRQNNSFRGNNTQRMRDTRRLNTTAQYNNWRNGYDTRPNASR